MEVPVYSGDTPALYGGSRGKATCDKEAQLTFLEQNPDKAVAFCEALNSDPTLLWNGGNQVRPDQLRDYFAELTPMILTHDTRVTNHGYRDGHPTPRQSVLQAGQGVLVDRHGVIRVRCECGNPLIPPRPVTEAPTYTGPSWEGFDSSETVVVQQSTAPINSFVVIDVETGEVFERPAGTTGGEDTAHEGETATTSGVITTSSASTSSSTTGSSSTSPSRTTATTTQPTPPTTQPPTTRTTQPTTTTTTQPPTTRTTQPTTTTTTEAMVKVPGVKGVGLERAMSLLDSAGLKVKLYRDIPGISYLVAPANPMDQRPSAGTLVPRGHVVELRVYGLGENYPIWPY